MTSGRPRATSRDTISEAACELFLEQGFAHTSVAQITQRAGVSRSSFFNYFTSKSDVLWAGLDEQIVELGTRLSTVDGADAGSSVMMALRAIGDDFAPDSLALALVNTEVMGFGDEFDRDAGLRRARIAHAVATRLRGSGADPLRAEVAGAACGGAVLAAIGAWAQAGAGQKPLAPLLDQALAIAAPTLA